MPIRVAIVEDDPLTLEEYATAVAREPDLSVVGRFETVESALRKIPSLKPDVILMDIQFRVGKGSERSGIGCTRELKRELPDSAILMLTVVEDDENIFAAIRNGADGYVLKQAKTEELLTAIRQVAEGGSPMIPSGIARKVVRLIQRGGPASPELASLSGRELDVLQLIALGLRDADVARSLGISVETVGTYLRRTYKKLHVHCRTEAAAKLLSSSAPLDKNLGTKPK